MKGKTWRSPLACLVIVALVLTTAEADMPNHKKVVVCYMGSWAAYRPDSGQFTWENIDPTLCTHLIYSFAGLDRQTLTIRSLDPFLDLEDDGGRAQYKKFIGLKSRNPRLKVTIAIGGWNEGSGNYSLMASSPNSRKAFIDSCVSFIRKHGFDGLDMDWEYPGKREGSRPEDKENFILLLKELRKEFDRYGYLLTAAVGAAPDTIKLAYNVPEISKYLDFIHLMCYDYHGSWDGKIGHNAPMKSAKTVAAHERLSVEDTVSLFIQLGAPREKLVLGVPFYGRTFVLKDSLSRSIDSGPSEAAGFAGPFTREDGFHGYNEICREKMNSVDNPWTEHWDDEASVPYMERGNKWISYDNERSISVKSEYAHKERLAGVMIWSIDTDDFRGECTPKKYPLLRSINEALERLDQIEENEISQTKPTKSPPANPNGSSPVSRQPSAFLLITMFTFLCTAFTRLILRF